MLEWGKKGSNACVHLESQSGDLYQRMGGGLMDNFLDFGAIINSQENFGKEWQKVVCRNV